MVTLIDFYADWCGPCKVMKPVLKEISKEFSGKLIMEKVNVDTAADQAHKYNVSSIPTLVFEKDGKEQARLIGAQSKEAVVAEVQKHIS